MGKRASARRSLARKTLNGGYAIEIDEKGMSKDVQKWNYRVSERMQGKKKRVGMNVGLLFEGIANSRQLVVMGLPDESFRALRKCAAVF